MYCNSNFNELIEHMQHDKCKKMQTNRCILTGITSSVDSNNDRDCSKEPLSIWSKMS